MNEDKIQVGDLVQLVQWIPPPYPGILDKGASLPHKGIGLVVRVHRPWLTEDWLDANKYVRYRVYWFELGALRIYYGSEITKLCPTQEEQNE